MIPLKVKFLIAFTCFKFITLYPRAEAGDTCPTTTTPCIPGLPGRDGKDGAAGRDGTPGRDGRDGLPGPPGSLTFTEQQQLKEGLLEMLQEEISKLIQYSSSSSSTHQSLQCNGIPEDTISPSPTISQQFSGVVQDPSSISPVNNVMTTPAANSTRLSTPQPTPQPGTKRSGTSMKEPATSCKQIYECDPTAPSGYYWVSTTAGPVRVYCIMDTNNCGNITGGWMRAAYIDMTNVSNTCPQGLNYTVESSTRMCTRSHSDRIGCSSVTFPTHGVPYTKVCGRVRGYQYYATDSFYSYHYVGQTTLDSAYVTGLSVTYGSLQNHIWTFAVGYSRDYDYSVCCNCPCAPYPGPAAPPFVGGNYFCESGNSVFIESQWYLEDPLWDSQGCASGSTCCNRGGPWFTTTLSQEVSDDIEMRLCTNNPSSNQNIGVDQLEIFIY